jgi:hypothetical protein
MATIQVRAREVLVDGDSVVPWARHGPRLFTLCNRCGAGLSLAIQRLGSEREEERSP